MHFYRRRLGEHRHNHGGSRHIDSGNNLLARSTLISMTSSKRALPISTADVSSLPSTPSSSQSTVTNAPPTKTLAHMATISSKNDGGHFQPISLTQPPPSIHSHASSHHNNSTVTAHKSSSSFEKLSHKPIIWTTVIVIFLIFGIAIVSSIAIKKRKEQKKLNEEKMMKIREWHRNQGIP